MRARDLTGHRFGRLVAISAKRGGRHGLLWICECDCGQKAEVASASLVNGDTSSCGCLRRELAAKLNPPVHGHKAGKPTPEYRTWTSMWNRCSNEDDGNWPNYGGRGITVCERWKSFQNFLADMGPRPDGRTLDRIDPNGNYEPENCRWATIEQQNGNRRNSVKLTFEGRTQTISEWAREVGISKQTLAMRLRAKWPIADALTTPLRA